MGGHESQVRVGELVAQDAVGAWHRAEDGDRGLTLRILREDLAGQDHARLIFEEEIRRIERLDHAGLIKVHKVGRKPPRPWMLTDPIHGETLDDCVASQGPLAEEDALALVRDLHSAMRYLQARKQVHAAPLPGNVVLADGCWKLMTFRHIRAWDELKTLKGRKDPAPERSPPERARDHPAPLKPDPFISWSLGSLLSRALGATRPGEDLPQAAPARLAAMAARLLAADPAQRPAGERAVAALLAGEQPPAADPGQGPPAPIRAPVPRRRRPRR